MRKTVTVAEREREEREGWREGGGRKRERGGEREGGGESRSDRYIYMHDNN